MKRSFIISYCATVAFIALQVFLLTPPPAKAKVSSDTTLTMPAAPEPEHIFTEKDNGIFVDIPVGSTLLVELPANSTTGYNWELKADDRASDIVRVLGVDYVQPKPSRDGTVVAGASGTFQMLLRVEKKGVYPLVLVYHRPWETDVPAAKSWKLGINAVE